MYIKVSPCGKLGRDEERSRDLMARENKQSKARANKSPLVIDNPVNTNKSRT